MAYILFLKQSEAARVVEAFRPELGPGEKPQLMNTHVEMTDPTRVLNLVAFPSTRIMLTRDCDVVRGIYDPWGVKRGMAAYMGTYQHCPWPPGN